MTPQSAALQIIILGSGTCVPSLVRSACAILVSTGMQHILLDLGPGTLRRLLESGHLPDQIDHILLSHFHPDHSGELAAFLFASKYPEQHQRQRPLHLAGGQGMADFFQRLEALYGHWIRLDEDLFRLTEWPPDPSAPMKTGEIEIRTAPVAHNPESVAIRITDSAGRSVVYSGDTAPCDGLVSLAQNADMMICEAAIPPGQTGSGHLTPAQAGHMATRAGVRHLVLTHFYPECERADIAADARRTWLGPLTLATDLLRLTVHPHETGSRGQH
ncbi:MAG: ribonuclease Z [Pseudomonadota bacterium]